MELSSVYYYQDTHRVEYRYVLKEGQRMTPDEKAHMESFGCYYFYINRYITEQGTIRDEVCFSINRDVLEQTMNQTDRDTLEVAIQNSPESVEQLRKNNPDIMVIKAQLIETIYL